MDEEVFEVQPMEELTQYSANPNHKKKPKNIENITRRVVGIVRMNDKKNEHTHLKVKIKAAVGMPLEAWSIPLDQVVSIPLHVKDMIEKRMFFHKFNLEGMVNKKFFRATFSTV